MKCWIILFVILLVGCGQQAQPTQELLTAEPTAELTTEPVFQGEAETTESGISWHREGGIAGFCDDLSIYPDGDLVAYSCRTQPASETAMGSLTPEQVTQVNNWLEQYQAFTYEQSDGAVADGMTTVLIFNGTGTEEAPQDVQQEMISFAQDIFTTLQSE